MKIDDFINERVDEMFNSMNTKTNSTDELEKIISLEQRPIYIAISAGSLFFIMLDLTIDGVIDKSPDNKKLVFKSIIEKIEKALKKKINKSKISFDIAISPPDVFKDGIYLSFLEKGVKMEYYINYLTHIYTKHSQMSINSELEEGFYHLFMDSSLFYADLYLKYAKHIELEWA